MSVANFVKDLFAGNFKHAFKRLVDFFRDDVDPALEAWFTKFLEAEGKLALTLAAEQAQLVLSGQKTMPQAGSDLVAAAAQQGAAVALNLALDAIRTKIASQQAGA